MVRFAIAEIRRRFAGSNDFNEIFDAFEDAVNQRLIDLELYRLLFWNHSLTPDELCLFGEKLAKEFPETAFEVYRWLASVFAVTYSAYDNYELALTYYKKAAYTRPADPVSYLDAADCYESDLNIPPIDGLIEFLKFGLERTSKPEPLLRRLSKLYSILGDSDLSEYYKLKADEAGASPPPPTEPTTPPDQPSTAA
jgi:tetratricopeptide (TPR) repeat protein